MAGHISYQSAHPPFLFFIIKKNTLKKNEWDFDHGIDIIYSWYYI